MEPLSIGAIGAGTAGAAARNEPRIAIHCGVAIASTEIAEGARWLIAADATRHGPFDLVIAVAYRSGALPRKR